MKKITIEIVSVPDSGRKRSERVTVQEIELSDIMYECYLVFTRQKLWYTDLSDNIRFDSSFLDYIIHYCSAVCILKGQKLRRVSFPSHPEIEPIRLFGTRCDSLC